MGDGSAVSGYQLTGFGPSTVAAIKKAAPRLKLDVHLYAIAPERFVPALAAAGADRITFQLEALLDKGGKCADGGGDKDDDGNDD